MVDQVAVEQPVIDFDEMSWGDSKQIMIIGEKMQKPGMDSDAQIALFADLEKIIGPLITSIPRSWLVKRAPETLDYTQAGSLDMLRGGRFMELLNLFMANIVKVEDEAGESHPPLK